VCGAANCVLVRAPALQQNSDMRAFSGWVGVAVVLVAVVGSGCKKKQAPIQNHIAPVATQAAKPPAPAHPMPNVHAISELEREKAAYLSSAHGQLDDIQKQVASLQATTARSAGAARVEYAKLLNDVIAKRAVFQADIASVQSASQENWAAVRTKADHDLMTLRGSMQAANARIARKS
jgi:hypothetical protein